MSGTKHLIITRIATRKTKPRRAGARDGKPRIELDDGWFERRLELFRRYYAPTVNSQTDSRFTVLLCADPEFTVRVGAFRALLEVPVLVVETSGSWREAVRSTLHREHPGPWITTGLDSDDGIALDFVEHVRSEIAPDSGLNFVDGLQHSTDTGAFVHRRKHSNPFVSVHSTTGRWVFESGGHKKVAERFDVVDVRTSPMWLQVVHGGNASNAFAGDEFPYPSALAVRRFAADFERLRSFPGSLRDWSRNVRPLRMSRIRGADGRLGSDPGRAGQG